MRLERLFRCSLAGAAQGALAMHQATGSILWAGGSHCSLLDREVTDLQRHFMDAMLGAYVHGWGAGDLAGGVCWLPPGAPEVEGGSKQGWFEEVIIG